MVEERNIKIIGIKIKDGYFITANNSNRASYNRGTGLSGLRVNGEEPEKTYDPSWLYVYSKPQLVEQFVRGARVNPRYELKDPEIASDHIPLTLPKSEVVECCDSDCGWKEEYAHLRSLYELKYDEEPDTWEPVEFTFEIILEADVDSKMTEFSYPIQRGQWKSDGFTVCGNESIQNQEIDKIIWPSVLLKDRPSRISSDTFYKIVRKHVQDNIAPKFAKITSDYDFCFTVKKKINTGERPYVRKELCTVFEMTPASQKYRGYTVIPGMRGDSHEDLKNKIDKYLDDLMGKINEPLTECPRCGGHGVLFGDD